MALISDIRNAPCRFYKINRERKSMKLRRKVEKERSEDQSVRADTRKVQR